MNYRRNIPLIIAPYSKIIVGGIGTWTKNMIDYSESENRNIFYNIHTYANHLRKVTNTRSFARIISGLILYSRLISQVFILIRKYRPSILHITSSASIGLIKDLMLIWLSTLMKTPVIIHWHFGRIPTLAIQRNWEWKILTNVIKMSHSCIVIDTKSNNTLLNAGFINVINIPNPIGFYVEQKSKKLLSSTYRRPHGKILYVGHVVKDKGVFELVEACSQLPAIKELLLIGPYEEVLKKKLMEIASVRENGIWLKLTGTLIKEHVLEQMCNSPILSLPSYTEGFPYVVLEAMAMGCSVIATDVGAIPEMLAITSDTPCGVCVPIQDVERLRKAIIDLTNDPLKTEAMGKNGIGRVINNYTLEKVVEQYKTVWDITEVNDSQ
jgi:glycosyltransferase involved in cell wall biosynthesis